MPSWSQYQEPEVAKIEVAADNAEADGPGCYNESGELIFKNGKMAEGMYGRTFYRP